MYRDEEQHQQHYLSRKIVAEAFWNAELEDELRKRELTWKKFKITNDREEHMKEIDLMRAGSVYQHPICSEECQKRGKVSNNCTAIIM